VSLAVAAGVAPAGAQTPTVVAGTHVQTSRTSLYGPPSPDPAGIAYVAATDRFLISDSEVDEMPIYLGQNLFTATRTGSGSGTGTTVGFSNEPSGVGFDPLSRTLFVSDDDRDRVYVDRPGPDGVHGTADDSVTSFSTSAFGSTDPEGVEYDPQSGHVFVSDGLGVEVYDVDPVNGTFGDGDDTVTHFDVARYGSRDAEGLGRDPQRNVLLVVDPSTKAIYELTTRGALIRTIDCRGIPETNRLYAGVTMAPSSDPHDDPSRLNYWIVDRQVDNGTDPLENDGKLYEVSAPPGGPAPTDEPLSTSPPGPTPPASTPPAPPPGGAAPPAATLRGTAGNDVLVGTPGDDVIYGFGGHDVIRGRGGNDVVLGGAGNDRIEGGLGDDRLAGGRGHDTLIGGAGNDGLRGDAGRDVLSGNGGADFMAARDAESDALDGGPGRDEGRIDRGLDRIRSLERRR
jgi:Ca2+-binding RTX toxin-like protein